MNEPIISPLMIYLFSIVPAIRFVLLLVAVLCLGVCADSAFEFGKKDYDRIRRWGLRGIGFLFLASLIPNEDTCWKMFVASKVTPALLQEAGTNAENIAEKAMLIISDSVIKIIKEVK